MMTEVMMISEHLKILQFPKQQKFDTTAKIRRRYNCQMLIMMVTENMM